jgi:Uma2 family endonuclease
MFDPPPSASPDPSGWSISEFPALESHNAPVPNRHQYLTGHLEVRKRYVLGQRLS